jgi:hypothetical protein
MVSKGPTPEARTASLESTLLMALGENKKSVWELSKLREHHFSI